MKRTLAMLLALTLMLLGFTAFALPEEYVGTWKLSHATVGDVVEPYPDMLSDTMLELKADGTAQLLEFTGEAYDGSWSLLYGGGVGITFNGIEEFGGMEEDQIYILNDTGDRKLYFKRASSAGEDVQEPSVVNTQEYIGTWTMVAYIDGGRDIDVEKEGYAFSLTLKEDNTLTTTSNLTGTFEGSWEANSEGVTMLIDGKDAGSLLLEEDLLYYFEGESMMVFMREADEVQPETMAESTPMPTPEPMVEALPTPEPMVTPMPTPEPMVEALSTPEPMDEILPTPMPIQLDVEAISAIWTANCIEIDDMRIPQDNSGDASIELQVSTDGKARMLLYLGEDVVFEDYDLIPSEEGLRMVNVSGNYPQEDILLSLDENGELRMHIRDYKGTYVICYERTEEFPPIVLDYGYEEEPVVAEPVDEEPEMLFADFEMADESELFGWTCTCGALNQSNYCPDCGMPSPELQSSCCMNRAKGCPAHNTCPMAAHACLMAAPTCPMAAHACPMAAYTCPMAAHACPMSASTCPMAAHACPHAVSTCPHAAPACAQMNANAYGCQGNANYAKSCAAAQSTPACGRQESACAGFSCPSMP